MFARPLGRLRSDLVLRPFPERLSGICLEQANTLRSSPDRRPPLSERESQNNHVPWASNLSMKFIVLLAAPYMEEMPFLQSCEAMDYALAANHSEVSLLFGRQTESGANLGLCRLKNDRTDGFTRKILARFMNPRKSAFFNTLSKIK
jgi:hypothetical protein